ncbi:P2X purinoceptor 7-like [Dermacentor variabilis]|uniref:P2X purinoceptor 7-like n=1 Tax=Dermacentor variabilis TaxID=34621 RepID=UPI003F5C8652
MDTGSGASTSDEYISEDEDRSSLAKNILAYGYEPSASSDEEEQAAVDVPVRQPGPATWCSCGHRCGDIPTEKERVCCTEQQKLANTAETYECITKHPLFQLYCPNRPILDLEYLKLKHYCLYHLGQRTLNDQYRYTAYRQFVWWVYRRLGQGNRVVLPSCAVHRIRKEFTTPAGHYTGYLDA